MKKLLYITLCLVATLFASCSKDEVDVFDSNNYLSFKSSTISYTFTFLDASVTDTLYKVPVQYAGRYMNQDANFTWQVVDSLTTAVAGTHYKLVDGQNIIPANKNAGTGEIHFMRTPDMKNTTFVLTLQLVGNGTFLPGATDLVKISITDQIVKPDWWDYTYNRYMGSYSPTKLRLWLEYMGVKDGSNPLDTNQYIVWLDYGSGNYIYKNYKDGPVKAAILAFKVWLREKKGNPYDEDLKQPVAESLGNF
jgi:hypothetical protein